MRRTLFAVFMLVMVSVAALGQETTDTVTLGEVVVKGARVVRRVDGKTLYPTEIEKKHSHSGYSLLNKLALPDIRIDEMSRSVQSISNRGDVQVRINDIVANANDMQAIDVANITSVDYIDNPGVRYGNGIAYVINIRTRRSAIALAVHHQTAYQKLLHRASVHLVHPVLLAVALQYSAHRLTKPLLVTVARSARRLLVLVAEHTHHVPHQSAYHVVLQRHVALLLDILALRHRLLLAVDGHRDHVVPLAPEGITLVPVPIPAEVIHLQPIVVSLHQHVISLATSATLCPHAVHLLGVVPLHAAHREKPRLHSLP